MGTDAGGLLKLGSYWRGDDEEEENVAGIEERGASGREERGGDGSESCIGYMGDDVFVVWWELRDDVEGALVFCGFAPRCFVVGG